LFHAWFASSFSLFHCYYFVCCDFFGQKLRPRCGSNEFGTGLCVDISKHLLAAGIRVGDIVQIDNEFLRLQARGSFQPDPIEFARPRTCHSPFQSHLECIRLILNRDSQRIQALISLALYKACGVPNSCDERNRGCTLFILKKLMFIKGETNHS